MKKMLIFACILFSVVAKAQQSNFFDAEKHLQKLNSGKKEMKINRSAPFLQLNRSTTPFPELSYTLPNGDKVIALPLDNMPCVKPDMSQFQAMPNAGKDFFRDFYAQTEKAGTIPNGAIFVPMNRLLTKRK
jgi:hypothetical protein